MKSVAILRSQASCFVPFARIIIVLFCFVVVGSSSVSAESPTLDSYINVYEPPLPAPPSLPPLLTPIPPELPPVPPVAPPTLPPYPTPVPVPVPPGLPLPPVLPPPPSLPGVPVLPTPSPTPGAEAFVSIWTEGFVTPVTSGVRTIQADQSIQKIEWSSVDAVTCEANGFVPTNVLGGIITAPDTNLELSPGESRTYSLRCRNAAGVWSPWRDVTITKNTSLPTPTDTAPETPIIRGADLSTSPSLSAPTGFAVPFTVQSTDEDGDMIRYQFDWDDDGGIDQIMPNGVYMSEGTPLSVSYIWSVSGNYSFSVRAQDETGRVSSWATHSLTIEEPAPVPPADPYVSLSLGKNLVRSGDSTTVTLMVSADYELTCSLYGVSGGVYEITYPGGVGLTTYTRMTDSLSATQIIRAVCVPVTSGFVLPEAVREARVHVVPRIEEI